MLVKEIKCYHLLKKRLSEWDAKLGVPKPNHYFYNEKRIIHLELQSIRQPMKKCCISNIWGVHILTHLCTVGNLHQFQGPKFASYACLGWKQGPRSIRRFGNVKEGTSTLYPLRMGPSRFSTPDVITIYNLHTGIGQRQHSCLHSGVANCLAQWHNLGTEMTMPWRMY
jgi:hypothetical protein